MHHWKRYVSLSFAWFLSSCSLERKDIFFGRLLQALLVVLLPHLGPRAAVHVGHLVVDVLARRHRRRLAVERVDGRNAFDVDVRVALLEAARLDVVADDA